MVNQIKNEINELKTKLCLFYKRDTTPNEITISEKSSRGGLVR